MAVDSDGREHVGVNVENAAFGSTICAEAHAVAAAAATGVRKIDRMAVVSLSGPECYPCGNCRQVMNEFEVDEVVVEAADGSARVHEFGELFPHKFGPEDLTDSM